jgi:NAD(P)-dependent dehydrogenase (short-subunit alcohol dehydrogenase family)
MPGIQIISDPLSVDEAHCDRMMNVNAKATWFACQTAIRVFLDTQTKGRIVNLASIAGKMASTVLHPAYNISKAAVLAMTKTFGLRGKRQPCQRRVSGHDPNRNAGHPFLAVTLVRRRNRRAPSDAGDVRTGGILVNNVGVQRRSGAEDFPAADLEPVPNVNLDAVLRFAQRYSRHMLAHGGCKIIAA